MLAIVHSLTYLTYSEAYFLLPDTFILSMCMWLQELDSRFLMDRNGDIFFIFYVCVEVLWRRRSVRVRERGEIISFPTLNSNLVSSFLLNDTSSLEFPDSILFYSSDLEITEKMSEGQRKREVKFCNSFLHREKNLSIILLSSSHKYSSTLFHPNISQIFGGINILLSYHSYHFMCNLWTFSFFPRI